MALIDSYRLKYGMRWKRRYPTPMDYKTETRFVASILLIMFLIWLAVSRMDYEAALVQEQINADLAQQLQLACLNQAVKEERGERINVGWVADGMLIGVECNVLSREAGKNVGRMM